MSKYKYWSEVEKNELDGLVAIGWINARDADMWERVRLVLLGQLDVARRFAGWHSELAGELEMLREVAYIHELAARNGEG